MDLSAIVRRWFEEVWNKGRMSAIDEMASADVIGHGQAQHGVDIGLRELRPFVEKLRQAFPDVYITIHATVEQGENVVARWTATMTHRGEFLGIAATGRRVTVTGTTMLRIVNGKIVEAWDNWDQLGLLVQLGAMSKAEFVPERDEPAAKAS
jgi:steroid delta-isomerase-like uncharacterized protein